jgi:hypothetical protein
MFAIVEVVQAARVTTTTNTGQDQALSVFVLVITPPVEV